MSTFCFDVKIWHSGKTQLIMKFSGGGSLSHQVAKVIASHFLLQHPSWERASPRKYNNSTHLSRVTHENALISNYLCYSAYSAPGNAQTTNLRLWPVEKNRFMDNSTNPGNKVEIEEGEKAAMPSVECPSLDKRRQPVARISPGQFQSSTP